MNDKNTINLETSTYDNLIEQKLTELKMQKDKEWDEYQQKLDELQKEYNDKLDKIEESEKSLEMFRNINNENISVEFIENLADSLEKINLSEEEMLVVMSRLVDLSANDLNKEDLLEEEEIVTPEIVQPIMQKSNKEIESEILSDYAKVSSEIDRVYTLLNNFEENYYNATNISANYNIEKTKEQKQVLDNYMEKAGMCKRKLIAINADFAYLKSAIDSATTKNIVKNRDEIYSRVNRIKETINEFDALFPNYKIAYEKLEEAFKYQEEVLEEKVEKLENQGENSEEDIQVVEETQEEQDEFKEEPTEEEKQIVAEEREEIPEELIYAADFIKELESKDNLPKELLDLLNYSVKTAYENCKNEGTTEENLQMLDECIDYLIEKAKKYDNIISDENESEVDYDIPSINSRNLMIFLKDYDTNSFFVDEEIEKSSENKDVLNKAKKAVKSLMGELSTISLAELGKKPKRVTPIFGCGNWKRLRSDLTRTSALRIRLCEENMKKINELYGLDPNHKFNEVYLIGSSFVKRDGKQENDLKPLRDVLDSNQKQIEYITQLMNNPKASIEELGAIVGDSFEEYETLNKGTEQRA